MRKITSLLLALTAFSGAITASTVPVNTAQQVAANFYGQNSPNPVSSITLAYTETDNSGNAVYYVFNINGNGGFVIVSADDALHPIIGYSNKPRAYAIPSKGTNIDFWMQKRKTEIIACKAANLKATPDITDEWTSYIVNKVPLSVQSNMHKATQKTFPAYKVSH